MRSRNVFWFGIKLNSPPYWPRKQYHWKVDNPCTAHENVPTSKALVPLFHRVPRFRHNFSDNHIRNIFHPQVNITKNTNRDGQCHDRIASIAALRGRTRGVAENILVSHFRKAGLQGSATPPIDTKPVGINGRSCKETASMPYS